MVYKEASFRGSRSTVTTAIAEAAGDQSITPTHVYGTALKGFAAELSAGQVAALRADPRVAYVEPDAEVKLFTTQTVNLFSWGLDRIDDNDLPIDLSYTYTADGTGVTAYILDTGINPAHLDFGTRAGFIPNGSNGDFVNDGHGSAQDCNGHGTHVSGTVGGVFSGVAKNVTILVGRVVNCSGGGNASMVIAGMDWIAANGVKPAVVNMSLGLRQRHRGAQRRHEPGGRRLRGGRGRGQRRLPGPSAQRLQRGAGQRADRDHRGRHRQHRQGSLVLQLRHLRRHPGPGREHLLGGLHRHQRRWSP